MTTLDEMLRQLRDMGGEDIDGEISDSPPPRPSIPVATLKAMNIPQTVCEVFILGNPQSILAQYTIVPRVGDFIQLPGRLCLVKAVSHTFAPVDEEVISVPQLFTEIHKQKKDNETLA